MFPSRALQRWAGCRVLCGYTPHTLPIGVKKPSPELLPLFSSILNLYLLVHLSFRKGRTRCCWKLLLASPCHESELSGDVLLMVPLRAGLVLLKISVFEVSPQISVFLYLPPLPHRNLGVLAFPLSWGRVLPRYNPQVNCVCSWC